MISGALPSGVTVTQQTLDLLFQVRILARQPQLPRKCKRASKSTNASRTDSPSVAQ
jgi:hypothetical protein